MAELDTEPEEPIDWTLIHIGDKFTTMNNLKVRVRNIEEISRMNITFNWNDCITIPSNQEM